MDKLMTLVEALRAAARDKASAAATVKQLLSDAVVDSASLAYQVSHFEDDDVILYEDDDISIWYCRFRPGNVAPPHDHQMCATIAVFEGVEVNTFYRATGESLEVAGVKAIHPGQVVQFDGAAIHGVACQGALASQAIHVYLGKITTAKRSLFDPSTGQARAYENNAMDSVARW